MAQTAKSAELGESLQAMSWFDSVDFSDGGSRSDYDDDGEDGEECDLASEEAPAPGADTVDFSVSADPEVTKEFLLFLSRDKSTKQQQQQPQQQRRQKQRRRHSTAAAPNLATILDNESYAPPPLDHHASFDERMLKNGSQTPSAADGGGEGRRSRSSRSSRIRKKHGSSSSSRSRKKRSSSGGSSSGSSSRLRKSSSSSRSRKSSSSSSGRSRRKDGSSRSHSGRKDGSSRVQSRRKDRSSSLSGSRCKGSSGSGRSGRKDPLRHSMPAYGDGRGGEGGRGGVGKDLVGPSARAGLETIYSERGVGEGEGNEGEGGGGTAGETPFAALNAYAASNPFDDEVGLSQPQDDAAKKCGDGRSGRGGGGAAVPSEPEDGAVPSWRHHRPSNHTSSYTPPVDIIALASKTEREAGRGVSTGGGGAERDDLSFISEELPGYYHLEEFAGQRALLRLEQELSDHSECHRRSTESEDGGAPPKLAMDRRKLARVPQVRKSDLIIGEYLGRGTFCDVFEVTWLLPQQWSPQQCTSQNTESTASMDDDDVSRMTEASMDSLALSCSNDLSLIGGNEGLVARRSFSQVRTSTGGVPASKSDGRRSFSQVMASMAEWGDDRGGRRAAPVAEGFMGGRASRGNPEVLALKCLRPAMRAEPRNFVIGAEDLVHETALLASLSHPNIIQLHGRADGCFSTAFLRGEHPDDSSGGGTGAEKKPAFSGEGYFIIIDRLAAVLPDRIDEWKFECQAINGVAPPNSKSIQIIPESTLREHLYKRLKVAYCVADAMEYLHSRSCVFRDLKPANVGFDSNDCVKVFDFGFATSVAPLLSQPYDGYGPLTETCGTRRYMAPEMALKLGYGMEVDIHSFGLMLWEICAMKKPFESMQSVEEFDELVMRCENRPSLNIDPLWTASLKNLMCLCWTTDPSNRPKMSEVKMMLRDVLREINEAIEATPHNQRNSAQKVENPFQRWWRRSVTM